VKSGPRAGAERQDGDVSVTKEAQCGFCKDPTDVDVFGDGVVLTVTRAGSVETQILYAHLNCIRRALHEGFEFGPVLADWPRA